MVRKNPHIGSRFEDWLDVVGIREEAMAAMVKKNDHHLKRRDREVLGLDDFTDADIEALENAKAPPESAAFDEEIKA